MTSTKRSFWRVPAKVLAASACLAVPALALAVLGGSSLGLLSGRGAASDEFRVYDPPAAAQAKAAQPAQAGEPAEVELTSWEKTLKGSNSL